MWEKVLRITTVNDQEPETFSFPLSSSRLLDFSELLSGSRETGFHNNNEDEDLLHAGGHNKDEDADEEGPQGLVTKASNGSAVSNGKGGGKRGRGANSASNPNASVEQRSDGSWAIRRQLEMKEDAILT